MKNYNFGKRLKYFRETKGMTQAALAEKINKSTHHITQMERGMSLPSLPIFFDLCRALDVPADYFVIDEDKLFAKNTIQDYIQKFEKYSAEELTDMAQIMQIVYQILEKRCDIQKKTSNDDPETN